MLISRELDELLDDAAVCGIPSMYNRLMREVVKIKKENAQYTLEGWASGTEFTRDGAEAIKWEKLGAPVMPVYRKEQ